MKGDFSSWKFDPRKHYSSVLMQQGRVQLDSDWNEQDDIRLHGERIVTTDVIGGCGTPASAPGFGISFDGTRFMVGAGRYFVDGIRCENEADVAYADQPDYPGQVDPVEGVQFFYLDVWEEHVTALEDPGLREVALNGPDTTTRRRVVWQVRTTGLPVGVTTCEAAMATLAGATDATMRARARTPDDTEACTVKPGASYKRLENQLYRVEVHQGGDLANASFKWSRDNGSIVSGFTIADGRTLIADQVGRDQILSFRSGHWIEITDRRRELLALPGDFFQIARVEGSKLILSGTGPAVNPADYGEGMKARRWDSQGAIPFGNLDADGYMALEDGVQVRLAGTDFRTGDYWLVPARTVTGDVEWPQTGGAPDALPPFGIVHHRCALALATPGEGWTIVDCRDPFVPLTRVVGLFYVSGDGQTATPDPFNPGAFLPLPQDPVVGVARGNLPVAGASVRFTVALGSGQIAGASVAATDGAGLAACPWQLSSTDAVQQLRAELLDSEGQAVGLPVLFTATLNTADRVAYDPGCPDLRAAEANTVQKAIDALCRMRGSTGCCRSVGRGGDFDTIEEALKALLETLGPGGICLCLMPGRSNWPVGFQFPQTDAPVNLTLTGIRGASILTCDGEFVVSGLGTVVLSDLIVETPSAAFFRDIQEVDIDSCVWTVRKRLEMIGVGTVRFRDTRIDLEGSAMLEGCNDVQIEDCDLRAVSDDDALTIRKNDRLRIAGSVLVGQIPSADRTVLRLAGCRQTVIEGNEFQSRLRSANTNPATGLVGSVVAGMEGRLASREIASRARTLLGGSASDRSERVSELSRFVAESGISLGAHGAEAVGRLRDALAAADATEATVGAAIGDLNERVAGTSMEVGALAAVDPFGVALTLMDGSGQCRVSRNVIFGYVCLYGDPGSFRMTAEIARLYRSRIQQGVQPWGVGMLHFSENDLLSILTSGDFSNPNGPILAGLLQNGTLDAPVFRMVTIGDNTLNRPPIEVVCSALTFSGNEMNQNVEFAGVVVGHRATYTGNLAYGGMALMSATEMFAEAGNLALGVG